MEAFDQIIGIGLTAGLSVGGVWFVIRLLVGFQRDFIGRYKTELEDTRGDVDHLNDQLDKLRADHRECLTERARLRALVRDQGLTWQPTDWNGE